MKKTLLLLLMLLCAIACLTACGDDDDDDDGGSKKKKPTKEPTEEVTEAPTPEGVVIGSTETWGDLTVGVPADWTFRKGDAFDEEDTRYCSVKKSTFKYFDFKMEAKEVAEAQYNYNKQTYTNEQTDVSGTFAGIEWTGFQYSDGMGGFGFELLATVGEKPIRVSSCGFSFDSAEVKAVLESVVVR